MKKLTARLLSVCFAVSIFACLSSIALAAENNATEMWYCGQKLDAQTPYLLTSTGNGKQVKASSTATAEGAFRLGATFDSSSGTLTFNSGVSNLAAWDSVRFMKQIDTNGDGSIEDEKYYGIYADGNLTIDMGGYAQWLFLPMQSPQNAAQEGIHVNGDLTINGSDGGTLKVTANPSGKNGAGLQSYGVFATGNVTLNGGLLDIYTNVYTGGEFQISNNKTTLIEADDVALCGGALKLRGKGNSCETLYNIRGGDNKITVPSVYNQSWARANRFGSGDGAMGKDETSDFHSDEQPGDKYASFSLKSGYEIIVAGVVIGGDKTYLVPSGEGYAASSSPGGSVAEYDIDTRTLTFTDNVQINCPGNWGSLTYCIKSESDLTVEILSDVTLTLNGENTQRNKIIWAQGDLTVCGEGTLKANAFKDWAGGTDKSAVLWSDNGNIKIEGGISARLYTRELTQGQIAHVIYAGGGEINIGEYASVIMGTDIGKLFNDGAQLFIYEDSEVQMAAQAQTNAAGPTPTGDLIPYDSVSASGMKYITVSPMPMELDKIGGFDSWGMLPLSAPKIELKFKLPVAAIPSVSDLLINNGASVSAVESGADNKTLNITLGDLKADGEYTLKLKNIKNAAGLEYTAEYSFKVSKGQDVLGILLNGSENGRVSALNTVEVTLSKAQSASEMNALAAAVVWEKVDVNGESVKRLKSVSSQTKPNISGTVNIKIENIEADAGNIIEVFVWNSGTGLKTLCKAAEFANE